MNLRTFTAKRSNNSAERIKPKITKKSSVDRVKKNRDVKPANDPWPEGERWHVLRSRVLNGAKILLVFRTKDLNAAREAYPGLPIYFPQEIEELLPYKENGEKYTKLVNAVHEIKTTFDAWIAPNRD